MFSKTLILTLVALTFLPTFAKADDDLYAKCQDTCSGNGLSCVKKCVAAGNGSNSGATNDQAAPSNDNYDSDGDSNTAVVVDGDNVNSYQRQLDRRIDNN